MSANSSASYHIPPYNATAKNGGLSDLRNEDPWSLYHSPEGYPYYYNKETEESKWANDYDSGRVEQLDKNQLHNVNYEGEGSYQRYDVEDTERDVNRNFAQQNSNNRQYESSIAFQSNNRYGNNFVSNLQDVSARNYLNQNQSNTNYRSSSNYGSSTNANSNNNGNNNEDYADNRNFQSRNSSSSNDSESSEDEESESESDEDDDSENDFESDVESSYRETDSQRIINQSERSVYSDYAISNRTAEQVSNSKVDTKSPKSAKNGVFEAAFREYLQTPQGMAAMLIEQKRILQKMEAKNEKFKPTHNTLDKINYYDPKAKKSSSKRSSKNNSGNVFAFASLLAPAYSTLSSLWGSKSPKKESNRNHMKKGLEVGRHIPVKEERDPKKTGTRPSSGTDIKERRPHKGKDEENSINTAYNDQDDSDDNDNNGKGASLPLLLSRSSSSLDSVSSDDSDVKIIMAPVFPTWLTWSTLSYNAQSYIFGPKPLPQPHQEFSVGSLEAPTDEPALSNPSNFSNPSILSVSSPLAPEFQKQRKELWDKVSAKSVTIAQNLGSAALFSLQWVAIKTGTGASIVVGHVWARVNSALQRYVEDATEIRIYDGERVEFGTAIMGAEDPEAAIENGNIDIDRNSTVKQLYFPNDSDVGLGFLYAAELKTERHGQMMQDSKGPVGDTDFESKKVVCVDIELDKVVEAVEEIGATNRELDREVGVVAEIAKSDAELDREIEVVIEGVATDNVELDREIKVVDEVVIDTEGAEAATTVYTNVSLKNTDSSSYHSYPNPNSNPNPNPNPTVYTNVSLNDTDNSSYHSYPNPNDQVDQQNSNLNPKTNAAEVVNHIEAVIISCSTEVDESPLTPLALPPPPRPPGPPPGFLPQPFRS
jgi:hypothetical protein